MRRAVKIIDLPRRADSLLNVKLRIVAGTAGETAIFILMMAGVYFSISFIIISLFMHLNKVL